VPQGTVTGGPYLPIANPTFTGTLSGPTLSIQNQINTTSSNLEINYQNGDGTTTNFKTFTVRDGKNALVADFVGSTKSTTLHGSLTVTGNQYFNGEFIEGDGIRQCLRYSDSVAKNK
jgi:ABC-type transport system involved in cytochrome bd biosynthesis fused ATPase/permease subunit